MIELQRSLKPGDALLIVDVQNDFFPGGALPVEDGDAIVPVLNRWIEAAIAAGVPIYASRDWHPEGHISFEAEGGNWPPHCLQDSEGAQFHPGLALPADTIKITKGVRFDHDQNSAFDQTGLIADLHRREIAQVWVGGLALDVCVAATALDGRQAGLEIHLIQDASRAITPEGAREALQRMREAGVDGTGNG